MANEELKIIIDELTDSDKKMLAGYQQDIFAANEDLIFHENKIKYYNALIEQREAFIIQLRAKLKRINTLESKIIKTLN